MSKQPMSTKEEKKAAINSVSKDITQALLSAVDVGVDRDEESELFVLDMFRQCLDAYESTIRRKHDKIIEELEQNKHGSYNSLSKDDKKNFN